MSFGCEADVVPTNIVLSGQRCQALPLEPVHVMLAGKTEPVSSTRFAGKVLSLSGPDKLGNVRITIQSSNGTDRVLVCRIAGALLRLEQKKTYEFQVDYAAGTPTLSGLLIHEGGNLLFAAASNQRPGYHVLKEDFGFKVELLSTACPSRQQDRCYEAIRNGVLRVTRGDTSVDLVNGESAPLAGFRVHCLTAQHVAYRKGCADAALVALSYAIVREGK